jgi:putative hydrolase of HD superfamily
VNGLIEEFNEGRSQEAKLARDADQLALILELKSLIDIGYKPPKKWLPFVQKRLETDTGRSLFQKIMETSWDNWWFASSVDSPERNK